MKSRRAAPIPATSQSIRPENLCLVANYTGGSIAVFPVLADGKLGEASSFVQHTGKGTNPERQEGPHAHSIDLSPDNRFAMVDDLGLDELLVYKFDSAKGSLTPNDPPFTKVDAGAGPRHFVLRPDGKFAYVITEMGHTVTVFSSDAASGKLQRLQTSPLCPRVSGGATMMRKSACIPPAISCTRPTAATILSLVYADRQDQGNADAGREYSTLEAKNRAASRSIPLAGFCLPRTRNRTTSWSLRSMRKPAGWQTPERCSRWERRFV